MSTEKGYDLEYKIQEAFAWLIKLTRQKLLQS